MTDEQKEACIKFASNMGVKCYFDSNSNIFFSEYSNICCEQCSKQFAARETDIVRYGYLGMPIVICPHCGRETYADTLPTQLITTDNLEFPQHFYHYGDGAKIDNEKTQEWCRHVWKQLKNSKENMDYSYIGSGDTIVVGFKDIEAIHLYVAKKYYEFEDFINE